MRDLKPVVGELSESAAAELADIDQQVAVVPWTRKIFLREFSNSTARIYGARLEGGLVAFLVCHVIIDECHVLNLAVRKNRQGQGIGRHVLRAVCRELYAEGVQKITLEVRVGNIRARKLYESAGFVETSRRESYYTDNGEDGLVMVLYLGNLVERAIADNFSLPLAVGQD